jgi:hypothetical protein
LADANLALAQGRSAVLKMEAWQERSLPVNREKALSLYNAWLLRKAKEAGLTVSDTNPSTASQRSTPSATFSVIGYQMQAGGTLSAITSFLYEFYRCSQLHQITKLQLDRSLGESQLRVTLEAEALILPGAIATDKLPAGESKRLKLASRTDYQQSLGEREIATVYTPPGSPDVPPAMPSAPPKFDESELARFSATVSNGNRLQAWIHVRATGETLHLSAGEPVKVGSLEGQIVSIESRSLVLQVGDKKFRVALGESLRKGKELDADGKAVSDAPDPEPPKS